MKPMFLAQINGQLFAVEKDRVVGVGGRNHSSIKQPGKTGRRYLRLPDGNRAVICDLQAYLTGSGATPAAAQGHYLILNYNGEFLALNMDGRGRIITADETAAQPLPPAFSGNSRVLVSGALINCADLILLIDLETLFAITDWPERSEG